MESPMNRTQILTVMAGTMIMRQSVKPMPAIQTVVHSILTMTAFVTAWMMMMVQ